MIQEKLSNPVFVKDVEAAKILSIGAQHLRNLRCEGKGPSYCRLGKWAVRYKVDDLVAWAEQGRVEPDAA